MAQVRSEELDDGVRAVVAEVRRSCLCMVAGVYWRLILKYSDWPYPLVAMTHPGRSHSDAKSIVDGFFAQPVCCLDSSCGRKAQHFFINGKAMLVDSDF
eukprot:103866-Lingulodinium_polyedra.AAC.1